MQRGQAAEMAAKDYNAAISHYTEAIRLDPASAEAYHRRSVAYWHRLGKRLEPLDHGAMPTTESRAANRSDLENAVSDIDHALQIKPDDAEFQKFREQLARLQKINQGSPAP